MQTELLNKQQIYQEDSIYLRKGRPTRPKISKNLKEWNHAFNKLNNTSNKCIKYMGEPHGSKQKILSYGHTQKNDPVLK